MKCLVRGCTRTHRDAGVSFHRLPGKDPVRSRWLEALRLRANSKILHQLDRVCSEHFSAQSFTSWKVSKNLGFERKKKRLDEGSVPTLQLDLTPAPACKRRRLVSNSVIYIFCSFFLVIIVTHTMAPIAPVNMRNAKLWQISSAGFPKHQVHICQKPSLAQKFPKPKGSRAPGKGTDCKAS